MTPQEFIAALKGAAMASQLTTKIPASFVIADAALESGWGDSYLTVRAMNCFGVKADASWKGDVVYWRTREYEGGKWVFVTAPFRKYADWTQSLNDHANFLLTNERYKDCFKFTDGELFATAVAEAGYATDPNYASKIIAIITGNHLQSLDVLTITPAAPAPAPVFPGKPVSPAFALDPGQPAMTPQQIADIVAAEKPGV